MSLAEKDTVTIPMYMEMIRKKTAMLIGGSLSLGAIAAGADEKTREELYWLGEAAGLAFQLQDDLLDAFPQDQNFGKQVGGDILENKKTFLLIRAFEKADAVTREKLNLLLSEKNPEKKVKEVLQIFEQLEIKKETLQQVQACLEQVKQIRQKLISLPGFGHLNEYMEQLGGRQS